jgi:GNAT superfamily N-acetyltransferase
VTAGGRVVAYYALANGAVDAQAATGRIRRNMPDPIPVRVLGRLAMDKAYRKRSVGIALLHDAVEHCRRGDISGIRAIQLHAISDDAKRFYKRSGFSESPLDPMTPMVGRPFHT